MNWTANCLVSSCLSLTSVITRQGTFWLSSDQTPRDAAAGAKMSG